MKNAKAYFVPHPPLIIPEIGRGEQFGIQKTISAYETIAKEIADFKPHTIIFISPHALTYEDYFHIEKSIKNKGDLSQFQASEIFFEQNSDINFINQIEQLAKTQNIKAGTLGQQGSKMDHGVMVPMYFINKYFSKYDIVRLSFSGMSFLAHYNYGKIIQEVVTSNPEKRYVLIASGDLSHMLKDDGPYGFAKEGPLFDQKICTILNHGNFLELFTIDPVIIDGAGECGFRSLMILAGFLDKLAIQAKLLSYEGPFGVGYAVASFEIVNNDESRNYGDKHQKDEERRLSMIRKDEDPYVTLARQSLEYYVLNGSRLPKDKIEALFPNQRAGVFVSLKKQGLLRGCIGTILPTTASLEDEIIQNAISAGCEDPRFDPVEANELSELVYSVDILNSPEKISSPQQLDVKKYGVIVRHKGRSGLLLPNLEGVDSVEEQMDIVLRKAGIKKTEPYTLERFEVVRHK